MSNTVHLKPSDKYTLSLAEAAAYFGICDKRLRQMAQRYEGQGLFVRNGAKLLINRMAFERFMAANDNIY